MYKPRYVTRTIKTKKVTVLWVDLETNGTHTYDVEVPGHLPSEDKIIEYVQMTCDTSQYKPVLILREVEKEALYKMSEENFVRYAENAIEHVEGEDE